MRDKSFASQHQDLDSHEVSLRAVNGRDPPNSPKSGRIDCLATRGLCSQSGIFEQEGFFGVCFVCLFVFGWFFVLFFFVFGFFGTVSIHI